MVSDQETVRPPLPDPVPCAACVEPLVWEGEAAEHSACKEQGPCMLPTGRAELATRKRATTQCTFEATLALERNNLILKGNKRCTPGPFSDRVWHRFVIVPTARCHGEQRARRRPREGTGILQVNFCLIPTGTITEKVNLAM